MVVTVVVGVVVVVVVVVVVESSDSEAFADAHEGSESSFTTAISRGSSSSQSGFSYQTAASHITQGSSGSLGQSLPGSH
eukprot:gene12887-13013_t